MIVNQVRYRDGRRVPCEDISTEMARIRAEADGEHPPASDFLWIGLKDPSDESFQHVVSDELDLHPLAIEDAVTGDQRAKIERYDDAFFAVLKPLRYVEATSDVETGEIMIFVGPDFLLTVRRGEASPLTDLRSRLEATPDALSAGPWGVFHAILDSIVDQYLDIEDELQIDLEDIETRVFSPTSEVSSEEIYRLKREVLEFKRAALPMVRPVMMLVGAGSPVEDEELRLQFRDVADHLTQAVDNLESMDRLLSDVLNAHLAQVGVEQNKVAMQQNEDMRKISAWVAIAALPTMIAGVYGMNFDGMPELHATLSIGGREVAYGYYVVLGVMILGCLTLYRLFKRSGWL